MDDLKIIVGLGNPGKQYEYTRHNLGYRILETFVFHNADKNKKWEEKFISHFLQFYYKEKRIILIKPQTYMNLSGKSVEKIINYYKIPSDQLLIVYDDINLALGNIRIRKKGSSGGHRGVESIIQLIGTDEFPRLRVGIRNDSLLKKMDYPSFVLSRFLPKEKEIVENLIERATRALEDVLEHGLDYAMGEYNQTEINNFE